MNAFSVWVGLGAMVGLWRVARSAPQRQSGVWVNAGLLVLFFALAGARLSYVLMNWGYFSTHLIEAPLIWLGGLTWEGAVGGAGLAVLLLGIQYRSARRQPGSGAHLPLGWLGDRLYPLLPPVAITTWLGCWQTGLAYGAVQPPSSMLAVPSLDETGVYSLRFPLQPLAALTLLVFFAILETRLKPLRPAGRLSGLAVAGLLLNLLGTSLLRADPGPTWRGLRLDTWMAILYLALFLTLVILHGLALRAAHKQPDKSYSHPEQTSF